MLRHLLSSPKTPYFLPKKSSDIWIETFTIWVLSDLWLAGVTSLACSSRGVWPLLLFGTLKLEFLDLVTWGFRFKVLMIFSLVASTDGFCLFENLLVFRESFELYGVLIAISVFARGSLIA